jgi:hypothetical protein
MPGGDPEPLEEAVADEEVGALLEADIGGRMGKGVAVQRLSRGAGAALIEFVFLGFREILGRRDDRREIARLASGRGSARKG